MIESPSRPDSPAGEHFTRRAVTTVMTLIAVLAFAFSFGNVWTLGLRLGVPGWIAPLIGPSVDLSVVGLLVAVRYLTLRGVPRQQLRQPRALLVFCGIATMALNIAEPLAAGAYARAAFDALGPLLLVGWSEVGPGLLQQIHAINRRSVTDALPHRPPAIVTEAPDASLRESAASGPATNPVSAARPASRVRRHRRYEELLIEAKRLDIRHRAHHRGHPASSETVRKGLGVGAATARALVDDVRAAHESPAAVVP